MREKKLKPSIMLAAIAVTILAATAIGVYSNTPRDISAATGVIDVLNVGMCTTTDDSVFKESDCDDGDTSGDDYDVAGRDELNEVDRDMFYATYAYDPKTASDNPRAILQDTDLLKVRITDSGRDRRTGILVRGAGQVDLGGSPGDDRLSDGLRTDVDGAGSGTKRLAELVNETLEDAKVNDRFGLTDEGTIVETQAQDAAIQDYTIHNHFLARLSEFGGLPGDGHHINNTLIQHSGPIGFGIRRSQGTTDKFPPMALDGVIRVFGYEVNNVETPGTSSPTLPGAPNDGSGGGNGPIIELTTGSNPIIELDEDRGQGSRNGQGDGDDIAPWLTFNATIQSGKDIVIVAIYYQTSGYEELVGNQKEGGYVLSTNDAPTEYTTAQEVTDSKPVFTDDEMDDDDALVVKVEGDEGDGAVNLYLRETGRFDGVYEGYIRLTDANGRGSDITNAVQDEGDNRSDWGYTIRHGKAPTRNTQRDGDPKQKLTANEAAIVGVDQGPVKITYKDSDGQTRTYNVQIDIAPPTIAVTTPENGSTTSDSSPSFEGTFDDIGAGLAKDSFRLYADNNEDGADDDDAVLELAHPVDPPPMGNTVEVRNDYRGYGIDTDSDIMVGGETVAATADANPDNQFGVFGKSAIYFGSEDCDETDDACYIESRRYDDGDSSSRFDEDVRITGPETRNTEVKVDFQALVLDMAGNIGFSDAHEALPTFIGDFGTATDADPARNRTRDNVIGWYSRHTVLIDDKEPDFNRDRSVTGFYGSDKDGNPIVNKSGIMLVFDDKIDRNSITTSTFSVKLDDGNFGSVQDLDVDSDDPTRVYLLMDAPLKPDATPEISIATGQSVEDLAGNETTSTEADEFEAKDGIAPTFTLSLRDGSGTGTGNEGPESLTKNTIVVRIASDERIQGAPKLTVVCDDLQWTDSKGTMRTNDDETQKVSDLVDGLSGNISGTPSPTQDGGDRNRVFTCGKPVDDAGKSTTPANADNDYTLLETTANSRAGDAWEYTWRNLTGSSALEPGKLQVIVWGRDRSSFEKHDGSENLNNWESANTSFTFDNELKSPLTSAGGEVLPADGTEVSEVRPFILLEFSEGTTVTLDSVTIDDNAVTMDRLSDGRFVYWPPNLGFGDHTVKVEATDAAGNEQSFEYDFKVVQRKDFVIELLAGWNAISLPADPIDSTLGAVFTNPMVDSVLGWSADNEGSWRFAVRQDGVWSTSDQFGTLTDIEARYGYWVHSEGFIRQPVQLATIRRGQDTPRPRGIETNKGWNFVGVVDQDGDQTEDHFNDALRDSDLNPINAENYLGESFTRAYTWNPTFNRFDTLDRDENVQIGQGIWVFYGEGIAP